MQNKIQLSFCITTRNRADFIGEALDSIISQAGDNVEIVVVDGASTDNTTEVVGQYQKKFNNIVYRRLEKNGGVDRDMATAVELARGEYCWLFSDDDMLKTGAIERMLKEIKTGCEIYLCNITACDLQMRPIRQRFWLSRKIRDRIFNLHNKSDFVEYCNKANSIGALFSFWSSIVFRREEWNKTGFLEEFDGSAYASASVLLSFIKRKCRLKYIRDSLALWRSDNVSFQNANGLVGKFLLDFDGYWHLANKYLSDDLKMKDSFFGVMMREHPWYTIINATSFIDNDKQWATFKDKALKFGYGQRILNICYVLGRFKPLVSMAVTMKRKIIKSRVLATLDAHKKFLLKRH